MAKAQLLDYVFNCVICGSVYEAQAYVRADPKKTCSPFCALEHKRRVKRASKGRRANGWRPQMAACAFCAATFTTRSATHIYCGKECLKASARCRMPAKTYEPRICIGCSITYQPRSSRSHFCSKSCADAVGTKTQVLPLRGRTCRRCEATFDAVNPNQRFCRRSCRAAEQEDRNLRHTQARRGMPSLRDPKGERARRLAEQGGVCAICRTPGRVNVGMGSFGLDHDHETGQIRGVLCAACNSGLGHFKDDPVRLQAAIEYLSAQVPRLELLG